MAKSFMHKDKSTRRWCMKKGLVMALVAKFPQHTLVIHEFNEKNTD